MAIELLMPALSPTMEEGTLAKWLVKEGDIITEDQAVADVSTDKALVQIPSMYDGKVTKLYYKEGDIAKVHAPLFAIELIEAGTTSSDKASDTPVQPVASAPAQNNPTAPAVAVVVPATGSTLTTNADPL